MTTTTVLLSSPLRPPLHQLHLCLVAGPRIRQNQVQGELSLVQAVCSPSSGLLRQALRSPQDQSHKFHVSQAVETLLRFDIANKTAVSADNAMFRGKICHKDDQDEAWETRVASMSADKAADKIAMRAQKQLPSARDRDGTYGSLLSALTTSLAEKAATESERQSSKAEIAMAKARAQELVDLAQCFKKPR